MSRELTLAEQETALTMSADDRNTWNVFSDDPVWQRRFEAVGATLVKSSPDGVSKWYTLPVNQISLRQPRKELSDERKAQLGDHMRAMRAAQEITRAEVPNMASQENDVQP